jgi:hypothetical protein
MIDKVKLILVCILFLIPGCYNDEVSSGKNSSAVNDTQSAIIDDAGIKVTAADSSFPIPQPNKKWTVLIYMAADNNLSPYSTKDIEEMTKSGSDDNFNIVVLWDNDPGQDNGASNRHGYYYIKKGEMVLLKDIGEINMGKVKTAADFIDFAAKNFNADHFMWVYWNHGGAVDRLSKGIAWDDTDQGDHLSEVEQKEIMIYFKNKIGKKIDIVGFDACLMATGEIIYQYKNYANYLIASEQTVPGEGWDYNFLSKIKSKPAITPLTLSKSVLTYYKNYYSKTKEGADSTLSVINLSYADKFGKAIDDLCVSAMNSGVSKTTFANLSQSLPMFGYYSNGSKNYYYTKDLYSYLEKIINSSEVFQNVKEKAQVLMNLMNDKKFIVTEWHGSGWKNEASGISITLKYATTIYKKLDICKDTSWDKFLNWAGFPNNDYAF